jgi:hypothetical protein
MEDTGLNPHEPLTEAQWTEKKRELNYLRIFTEMACFEIRRQIPEEQLPQLPACVVRAWHVGEEVRRWAQVDERVSRGTRGTD